MRKLKIIAAMISVLIAGCMKMPKFDFNNLFDPVTWGGKTYNSGGVTGTFTVTNRGLNIQMVKLDSIKEFKMGTPSSELALFTNAGTSDEQPVHNVNISSFSIAKYDTTITQYVQFLNAGGHDINFHGGLMNINVYCGIISNGPGNYSVFAGGNYPITFVSWYDSKAYCDWLSSITGQTWRLPTEAEWEYAAVGNNGHRIWPWGDTFHTNYCDGGYDYQGNPFGNPTASLDGYGWTSPVGFYLNGKSLFGLFDMAGNVSEWCNDWFDAYYAVSTVNDPQGPVSSPYGSKVLRGGDFMSAQKYLRCSNRWLNYNPTYFGAGGVGFRVVRSE